MDLVVVLSPKYVSMLLEPTDLPHHKSFRSFGHQLLLGPLWPPLAPIGFPVSVPVGQSHKGQLHHVST